MLHLPSPDKAGCSTSFCFFLLGKDGRVGAALRMSFVASAVVWGVSAGPDGGAGRGWAGSTDHQGHLRRIKPRRFCNHHPSQKHPAPSHGLRESWENCRGRGNGDEKNLGAPKASKDTSTRKESGSHCPSSKSLSASPALPSPNPDAESQYRALPLGGWLGVGDQALTQRLCMADAAWVQNLGVKRTQASWKSITSQEEGPWKMGSIPSWAATTLMHHLRACPGGLLFPLAGTRCLAFILGDCDCLFLKPFPWNTPQGTALLSHLAHQLAPSSGGVGHSGQGLHHELCSSCELCQGAHGPELSLVWVGEGGVPRKTNKLQVTSRL